MNIPTLERVPPQNVDAERAVLGALLIPESGKAEVAKVAAVISSEDFYKSIHRDIYDAIQLINRTDNVDLLTVTGELERRNKLESIGGVAYLDEMLDSVPTYKNVEHYADMVKSCSLRRHLISAGVKLYNEAYSESIEIHEILSNAKDSIYKVQENTNVKEVNIGEAIGDLIKKIQCGGLEGIPTGIRGLDVLTTGYIKGQFYVIAGRPGTGKTSLAIKLMLNLCKIGKKPMLASIEMPAEEILLRALSMTCHVPNEVLRRAKEYSLGDETWTRITNGGRAISEMDMIIDDSPDANVNMLVAKIENEFYQKSIDIAFIDHMHLIPTLGMGINETEAYSNISRILKGLARRLNIPIVCLSQLRRLQHGNPRPTLQDLRGSGAIEQNADHAWFLYFPDLSDDNSTRPSVENVELCVEKNKSLQQGTVKLKFRGSYMEFVDPEEEFNNGG